MIEGHGDDAYRYEGIKSDFSSNICTHSSNEALIAHIAARPELISHYPEPEAWSLEKMIADYHDIDPRCVIATNGATEAIYLIAQTFASLHPAMPSPTFSEYEDASRLFVGAKIRAKIGTNASERWKESPFQRSEALAPKGVGTILWLCNPNNPTGKVYDQLYIDRMMAKYSMVVLDQSYEEYTDKHVMSARWASRTPYSIQIHSMTKTYGVPGLRIGYITAHESLTKAIRHYLRPWNMSAIAIEAGKFLLQHDELKCRPDLKEAQRLRENMQKIDGISVLPTQTNFMLCQLDSGLAHDLKEHLATEHKILIRDASNFRGLTPRHFRIAAQTPKENDALVRAIQEWIETVKK